MFCACCRSSFVCSKAALQRTHALSFLVVARSFRSLARWLVCAQRRRPHVLISDRSALFCLPIVACIYPPRQQILQILRSAHSSTACSSSPSANFFSSIDSFRVVTAVTILSREALCLSDATRSSFWRISSVFLTLKPGFFLFHTRSAPVVVTSLSKTHSITRFLVNQLFNHSA